MLFSVLSPQTEDVLKDQSRKYCTLNPTHSNPRGLFGIEKNHVFNLRLMAVYLWIQFKNHIFIVCGDELNPVTFSAQ